MKETLYSRRSNLVVGFHGCDQSIANKIIEGKDDLIASTNDYDWLGHGIYFLGKQRASCIAICK